MPTMGGEKPVAFSSKYSERNSHELKTMRERWRKKAAAKVRTVQRLKQTIDAHPSLEPLGVFQPAPDFVAGGAKYPTLCWGYTLDTQTGLPAAGKQEEIFGQTFKRFK